MFESIYENFLKITFEFNQIFASFKVNDFLDIILISLIIYFLFVFFIRTRLWRALFSLAFLFIIYFFVFALDLSVSKYFFDYLFQILAVILIVAFQKELRKMFELIFFSRLNRSKIKSNNFDELINDFLETISWLQSTKTGALIVFSGFESIDNYIENGFELNGKVSPQILMSIFDKTSPGHDGAVIIEFDKIVKFGAHLPLAENLELIRGHGTRHRAALGLAEETDALCLVVSEETGEISIAYKGDLKTVNNFVNLRDILVKFFKTKFSSQRISISNNFLSFYFSPAFFSLFLALLIWVFFNFQPVVVQKTFLVPVEFYNLPNNMLLDEISDFQVAIILKGKEHDFKLFNEKNLKVSIDISNLKSGKHRILINKENIKNIKNFDLVKVEPATIKFNLLLKDDNQDQDQDSGSI